MEKTSKFQDAFRAADDETVNAVVAKLVSPGLIGFLSKAYKIPSFVHEMAIEKFDSISERNLWLFCCTFAFFLSMKYDKAIPPTTENMKAYIDDINEFYAVAVKRTYCMSEDQVLAEMGR
jgi:hypothetical protein